MWLIFIFSNNSRTSLQTSVFCMILLKIKSSVRGAIVTVASSLCLWKNNLQRGNPCVCGFRYRFGSPWNLRESLFINIIDLEVKKTACFAGESFIFLIFFKKGPCGGAGKQLAPRISTNYAKSGEQGNPKQIILGNWGTLQKIIRVRGTLGQAPSDRSEV